METGRNLFNSEAFLTTVAKTQYPNQEATIEDVQVGEGIFRLVVVDGKVVDNFPFADYHQPVEIVTGRTDARQHRYLGNVAQRQTPIEEWNREANNHPYTAAPTVHLGDFPDWESYVAYEAENAKRLGTASSVSGFKKREKKMKKDKGEPVFVFEDTDPGALGDAIAWKRVQYRGTGVRDVLADPKLEDFFRELIESGHAFISSLYAGDERLAVHIAGRDDNDRIYSWIPATNPEVKQYSPGTALRNAILHELITATHPYAEFDFTYGDEAYKLSYSTHNRVLGAAGKQPTFDAARDWAVKEGRTRLVKYPKVYNFARDAALKLGLV